MSVRAEAIIQALGLAPHPEGGFFAETYRSQRAIDGRSIATAIYFLITAESPSRMHRVASDEIWHFYAGDPLEMLQLDGSAGRLIAIGNDLGAEQQPQVLVPGGVWQGVRVRAGGAYALVGATVSPGFDFADFQLGDRDELSGAYPEWAQTIAALT
ncbi:MAG TPA: cupin domain-containing protein [Candidatus Baltobacteraceae bacterium]|nr:cupin domain-containing protein [Candidatus Baltobacteraceae bacterium]